MYKTQKELVILLVGILWQMVTTCGLSELSWSLKTWQLLFLHQAFCFGKRLAVDILFLNPEVKNQTYQERYIYILGVYYFITHFYWLIY